MRLVYCGTSRTIRGVTKSGRPGLPSTRLQLPLVAPPLPPRSVIATHTETAVSLSWFAPAVEKPVTFNIYKAGASDPINSAPVSGVWLPQFHGCR